jgi:Zn-dependent protease with chaperone function
VVAHEASHLRARERAVRLFATVAGIAPGGRNAILAFVDLPDYERRADANAVATVDAPSLVGALRRIERLREQAASNNPGVLRRYLTAPYRLFYGRVLLDNTHDTVTERIAAVNDEQAND